MQIHAGQYKGRRIKTVKNLPYRPTTSIVRKSLFDILHNISGKSVLDLYAGTGVIGFEASSRGAKQVTFVDSSLRVNSLLKINSASFNYPKFHFIKQDALSFLNSNKSYDIIFADPPYNYNLLNELTSKASNRLNKDGIFVLESSPREFSTTPFKVKVYGDTQLTFWKNF